MRSKRTSMKLRRVSLKNILLEYFKNFLFSIVILNSVVHIVHRGVNFAQAQLVVPPIACPQYLEYLIGDGGGLIGRITLPYSLDLQNGVTHIIAYFSQKTPLFNGYAGQLGLYESEGVVTQRILQGLPISFRVDFPASNEFAKLTSLSVNNIQLCSDFEYPPPNHRLRLSYKLGITNHRTITPYYISNNPFEKPDNPYFITNNNNQINYSNQQSPVTPQYTTTAIATRRSSVPSSQTPKPSRNHNINDICGIENKKTLQSQGGAPLDRGQFPWLTAIYRKEKKDLLFQCGGTLLSASTVISAAHCFREKQLRAEDVFIFLGRHSLLDFDDRNYIARRVSQLIVHPEYHRSRITDADVALLHLQKPVSFGRLVAPICLWPIATNVASAGLQITLAGWGAEEQGHNGSDAPKRVQIEIARDLDCRKSLEKYQMLTSRRNVLCGRSVIPNSGVCLGDSGSGALMRSNDRWVLRGIVSAGITHNGKCNPAEFVYITDIAQHMSWIRSNMI